jgi:hypothetical protein
MLFKMKCPFCNKEINEDFIETKLGKLTFRIYKWSKPVKDFKIPKGFRMAEEREFIDLYDSGFETEKHPVVYFTKNRSKLNIKNGLGLSRLCLNRDLFLDSTNDSLADSNDDGRVVCVK